MNVNQLFHGANAGYLAELYEQFLTDPTSVNPEAQKLFQVWSPDFSGGTKVVNTAVDVGYTNGNAKGASVSELASALRNYGYIVADTDPLKMETYDDPSLTLAYHGLDETTLAQLSGRTVGGVVGQTAATALDGINQLRAIYSGKIGYDIAHVVEPAERDWLREAAESRRFHPSNTPINPKEVLEKLTRVEGFEQYLHHKFMGKKRFSIEGLDMMVPMLDILLDGAQEDKVENVMIGMAHRGRLNVLTHVMGKPYTTMLAGFKDIVDTAGDDSWTGDVKYHYGYERNLTEHTKVIMADNPSHLELVNPVLEGMARAAGTIDNQRGQATFHRQAVMPILIHGDAAFIGQGIVPETLNLSLISGWRTGGTIHIIANNQVGFTTDYVQSRSTPYASDIAKGFRIPVVHVNADDVEACIEVARMAYAYQREFEKDFLIDLIGYRKYGHNEGDEPRFTQPLMYEKVDAHKTVRHLWADQLEAAGLIPSGEGDTLLTAHTAEMDNAYSQIDFSQKIDSTEFRPTKVPYEPEETAIPFDDLQVYHAELHDLDGKLVMNPTLARIFEKRKDALNQIDSETIDWALAEWFAYASILSEGTPIRITGEDVERGTFSHRHVVLCDQETGKRYIPHQHLSTASAAFTCRNSALSENAAVGFEYGFSLQKNNTLVIWEGQFGDFVNGAQPIIDEYITSGKAKWNQNTSLVMLLPHGYEGQGPDHSTARLERFLSMAADNNIRVVYPTTAAQIFHLLRRQVALFEKDPRPLIVMSPKSLLRHPMARSTPRELTEGTWKLLIDDPTIKRPTAVKRIVFCTGKVYVDAMTAKQRPEKASKFALVRIEQLYRFPLDEVKEILERYSKAEEVVWLQEEPKNGGAWNYVRPLLEEATDLPIRYIGRPNRASPAEGYMAWHQKMQDEIMQQVYDLG